MVNVGDTYTQSATIVNNASLSLQQTGTQAVVVHNINYAGAVELHATDGTNDAKVDTDTSAGGWLTFAFHCTATYWYYVKNVSGGNLVITADGIVTHT